MSMDSPVSQDVPQNNKDVPPNIQEQALSNPDVSRQASSLLSLQGQDYGRFEDHMSTRGTKAPRLDSSFGTLTLEDPDGGLYKAVAEIQGIEKVMEKSGQNLSQTDREAVGQALWQAEQGNFSELAFTVRNGTDQMTADQDIVFTQIMHDSGIRVQDSSKPEKAGTTEHTGSALVVPEGSSDGLRLGYKDTVNGPLTSLEAVHVKTDANGNMKVTSATESWDAVLKQETIIQNQINDHLTAK